MTFNLLAVPEAARALRISKVTMWKYVNAGAITSVRVGGRVFVSESAITEYVQRNTRPAHVAA